MIKHRQTQGRGYTQGLCPSQNPLEFVLIHAGGTARSDLCEAVLRWAMRWIGYFASLFCLVHLAHCLFCHRGSGMRISSYSSYSFILKISSGLHMYSYLRRYLINESPLSPLRTTEPRKATAPDQDGGPAEAPYLQEKMPVSSCKQWTM